MINMKEQLVSMGERMGEKLVSGIGEASIKLGQQARGKCGFIGIYEPKIPIELLMENIDK